ncbi:MAG: hypothetical protein ACR2JY_09105 [Chloroflexota bacterium]
MVSPAEDAEAGQAVSIEFLMVSGETFTVQDFVDGGVADEALRHLGDDLASQLGTSQVRRFPYWEGEEFFFDAVRMDQVSAFSISLAAEEIEDEAEV